VTTASWLFLGSVAFLVTSTLLLVGVSHVASRLRAADSDLFPHNHDAMALEAGAGIFNSDDWDIVTRETSREFARKFRYERTVLALDWLRLVRAEVRRLVREHRHAARVHTGIRTVDEAKLAFEFLSFELSTAILWCLVVVRGPIRAARLLGQSLDSARELRRIAEGVMPNRGSSLSGIVKTNS
jgi:hypothetical protein